MFSEAAKYTCPVPASEVFEMLQQILTTQSRIIGG